MAPLKNKPQRRNFGMTNTQIAILYVLGAVTCLAIVGGVGVLVYISRPFESYPPLVAIRPTATSLPTNIPSPSFTPRRTSTPQPTATRTPLPTATIIPPAPLQITLLTLSELNSVPDLRIWLYEGVPVEHLELIPEIATIAEGSIEHVSSSWDGTIVFTGDSAMQIHMQKWQTETEAENAIAIYKSAHDVSLESIKNLPGIFITSSNTLELPNGKIIIDSLGFDYLNPITYTAMIHYSNVSFTIQAVFPRTNSDFAILIKKYINMQIVKLQEKGYR